MATETFDALGDALAKALRGEVRFDRGSRALYATDASNYRQVPIGVVLPRDLGDVEATFALCRAHGAPVLARGGGTSLAGQCCNEAVVIDCSKYMNRVVGIDPAARIATVEPGCILDDLRDAAAPHGLTFGPDPSTHNRNTLGGMVGNNSCGVHSVMAGRTADNVESLEVLTYDGLALEVGPTPPDLLAAYLERGDRRAEIYRRMKALADAHADEIRARYPRIPRRVSGFALDQLLPENGFHVARALVGSEGTCVFVRRARLRLVPSPPERVLLVLGFDGIEVAGDHVPEILAAGPIGLEGLGQVLVDNIRGKHLDERELRQLPDGHGWLLAEFGAETTEAAQAQARELERRLRAHGVVRGAHLVSGRRQQAALWAIREAGLPATARVPGWRDTWEGWEDAAVPPERLGHYLRAFRALLDRFGYHGALYGHFGDGCVHVRIDFDLRTPAGQATYRDFARHAAELVVRHGGSLSGEHGDGQSRAALLPLMYGERLVRAFAEFRSIWDPQGRMNPGKVVDPYPITSNLRLAARPHPAEQVVHFAYRGDDGSFARATERCVGVGLCRRTHGGVMCPSYMATHEEAYSTRGRARLLYEMLHGDPLRDQWRSDAVHEALDLCLSCKACKHDCPMQVDMATWKAEFQAHYYAGRLRPRAAWSMGRIRDWSRLAALAPSLANALARSRGTGGLLRRAAGIHPSRALPRFAPTTFRQWFARHAPAHADGDPVLLWADTFSNHFEPGIAIAAVAALEAAGCRVIVPRRPVCCGRPLFAWGWLEPARRRLGEAMEALEAAAPAGTPIVVLEPACASALRDELPDLCAADPRAARIAQATVTLGAFLQRRAGYAPPRRAGRVLVQLHCHQHAVLGAEDDLALVERCGLQLQPLAAGCCGMAGSFGFEDAHYEVSMRCAERTLLPALREAAPDTLVLADGFSCREQIRQGSGRRPLHLAQLLAGADAEPGP